MIIKCILEDKTVVYQKFYEVDLHSVVDSDRIIEHLENKFGRIESWNFTNKKYASYFLDIRDFIDDNIIYKINNKVVDKYEFLDKNSYEHLVGSFCSETVEDWNYVVGINYQEYDDEENYYESHDPYSDEPPDYD